MSELKELIENEIDSLNKLVESKHLFIYGIDCTFRTALRFLYSVAEVMSNDMPVEYVDKEVNRLYGIICDLNTSLVSYDDLTNIERTTILWHRHVLRKIVVKIIQTIEN